MFRKLFGETEEEQIRYLRIRSIVTIIIMLMFILAKLLFLIGMRSGASGIAGIATMGVAIMMLFVWGWPVLKRFFGITTLGAIFSGNVAIGVILFVVYMMVSYLLGIIFAFIGTARYIYLCVKYRTSL